MGGRKALREGLSLKKLNRPLPFPGGRVQVFFALLPEYRGKRRKTWKSEKAALLVGQTARRAYREQECGEILLEESLGRLLYDQAYSQEIPLELMAACLYAQRPFERIAVSLPAEGGEREAEQSMRLLLPYLKRLRSVSLAGERSRASELLEDYLYEEYGMVMSGMSGQEEAIPWLDLSGSGAGERDILIKENRYKRIDDKEALKFLDTAVKNGYNTEVN